MDILSWESKSGEEVPIPRIHTFQLKRLFIIFSYFLCSKRKKKYYL